MKPSLLIAFCMLLPYTIGIAMADTDRAPVAGGYRSVAVSDQRVMAAAKFAVVEHTKVEPARLLEVVKADRQVVAGTNYQLTLRVQQDKVERLAVATVYVDLKGRKKLTAWRWPFAKQRATDDAAR